MNSLQRDLLRRERRMVENYPDEMIFVREYKDEITLKMYNLCSEKFGTKPKIAENFISLQSPPKAEDEIFRWTVCCDGKVFIVSLVKDELVHWRYDSIFKTKHHSMPIKTSNKEESITAFIEEIAS